MLDSPGFIFRVQIKPRPSRILEVLQSSNGVIKDLKRPSSCRASQAASPLSIKIAQRDDCIRGNSEITRKSCSIREIELNLEERKEMDLRKTVGIRPYSACNKNQLHRKSREFKNMLRMRKGKSLGTDLLVFGCSINNISLNFKKRNLKKKFIIPACIKID